MKVDVRVPIRGGSGPLDCDYCDMGGFDFSFEHEAVGAALAEAGERGIDTGKPFTVVWDRLAFTLEVSQDQPED